MRLLEAAAAGDVAGLAGLVRQGGAGAVNLFDYDARTALHLACAEGHADAVRLLVAHRAKVRAERGAKGGLRR